MKKLSILLLLLLAILLAAVTWNYLQNTSRAAESNNAKPTQELKSAPELKASEAEATASDNASTTKARTGSARRVMLDWSEWLDATPENSSAGFVLLYFREQDLQGLAAKRKLWDTLANMEQFRDANKQLNAVIGPEMLGQASMLSPENTVIIGDARQSSVVLNFLAPDIYYFSISAYNAAGTFGPLSKTVSLKLQ